MCFMNELAYCVYICGHRFSEEMGFTGKKLRILSLGSGQEEKARELIKECCQTPTWVVLLNCHLVSML
jgi:Dynein heavy chain region D6 P-loop domain